MILETFCLGNFRNYKTLDITPSPNINIIVGDNAQGKTNLLEAIYFLSRGYSHRANNLQDLAYFGESDFFIKGQVKRQEVVHSLLVKMHQGKKQLLINQKIEKKAETMASYLNTILFEPEDLRIVKAGPEVRRRFMDEEIGGCLPHYTYCLKRYKKALSQRNSLLKDIRHMPILKETLGAWDEQLVHFGTKIIDYRLAYLKLLNRYARPLHSTLSGDLEHLVMYYQNNVLTSLEEGLDVRGLYYTKLQTNLKKDMERGTTSVGPHLDDLRIHINDQDAKKFASQGQQRTAAIALKLSQIEIYKENTGDYPLVLLDDIMSELDMERQGRILKLLGKTQAFITCTESGFSKNLPQGHIKELRIKAGEILNTKN